MRFDHYSEKIANNACTLMLQGYPISDNERLHLLKGISLEAKKQGNLHVWHTANDIIKNYERFPDFEVVDKSFILKNLSRIGLYVED